MATDFLHGVETVVVDSGPRRIETVRSAIIGIVGTAPDADVAKFPINTPVLINSRGGFAGIGLTGSLPGALAGILDQFSPYVVLIRVAEGASATEAAANIVGGVNGSTGARTGIQAFRDSQTIVGVTPMILIASGFTAARTGSTKNAVAAALEAIAGQLRVHAIVAGPSTTDAAAIAYRADFSSRRVFIVDPFVKILDTAGAVYVDEDPTALMSMAAWSVPGAAVIWLQNSFYLTLIALNLSMEAVGEVSAARMIAMPILITASGLLRVTQVQAARKLANGGMAHAVRNARRLASACLAGGALVVAICIIADQAIDSRWLPRDHPHLITLAAAWLAFAAANTARGFYSSLFQAMGRYREIFMLNLAILPFVLGGVAICPLTLGLYGAVLPMAAGEIILLVLLAWRAGIHPVNTVIPRKKRM